MTNDLDFPESVQHPRSTSCPVPVYCFAWRDADGKRCGNHAVSRTAAQDTVNALRAAGRSVTTCARFMRSR